MNTFRWTAQKEQAALLVAEDLLTNVEISAKLGVALRTLHNWKQHPEFAARVQSLLASMAEAVRDHGIASKQRRILALDDRWRRMRRLIQRRAELYAHVPGGETGLLVPAAPHRGPTGRTDRNPAATQLPLWDPADQPREHATPAARGRPGSHRPAVPRLDDDYILDAALLKELREHERQAALELGQWEEPESADVTLAAVIDEIAAELQLPQEPALPPPSDDD